MTTKKVKLALDSSITDTKETTIQLVAKDSSGAVVGQRDYTLTTRPADNEKYQKWVVLAVAGQSNSVGYDESENTILTNPNSDPDRIKQLGLFGDNNLKIIPLQSMAENLQNMTSFGVSAGKKGTKGLHLPLCELIAKHIPDDYGVIVVPVAYGMTHFSKAFTSLTYNATTLKPEEADPSNGTWQVGYAYHQMLRDRVKYCLDLGLGKDYNKFAGVIWCQGEADTPDFSGNTATAVERWTALVEQLAEDWKDYNACSPTGKMDKSVWFVHDTTVYWRGRSNNQEGKDVGKIWLGYQNYLGVDHVVNILPLADYTNNVNGGGTRTSTAYQSHYGNNAYRDVVAPRVLDCLLKHKMIHGQDNKARNATTFSKITQAVSVRAQGLDIAENGEVTWAIANTVNYTFNNGGWSALVFDEDVVEVELTKVNPASVFVYQVDESDWNYKSFMLGTASGFNLDTADRFWGVVGDPANAKDLNTGGFYGTFDKTSYTFPRTITKPTTEDTWNISVGNSGMVTVKLNGETLINQKDTFISKNAKPRIGLILGWVQAGFSNVSNTVQAQIVYARKSNGEVVRPSYYFDPTSLHFEDSNAQVVKVVADGISNLAVTEGDSAVTTIQATLKDKEITVKPLDAGSSTISFDLTTKDGEAHPCTLPVTIDSGVFYNYFKMTGTGYGSTYIVATGKGDKRTYFNLDTNLDLSLVTIKDYETAVKPYVTFDLEGKFMTYSTGTSGNAGLSVVFLYNGVEMGTATVCFSQTGSGNLPTNIDYKVRK